MKKLLLILKVEKMEKDAFDKYLTKIFKAI